MPFLLNDLYNWLDVRSFLLVFFFFIFADQTINNQLALTFSVLTIMRKQRWFYICREESVDIHLYNQV